MEHESSSHNGYHEPKPGRAGRYDQENDWSDPEESRGDHQDGHFSVNLIWAQATSKNGRQNAIGFQGGMPWHLSEDLKRFKELTISHPVIMGRKTWESLGEGYRPLKNRDNIVVSRNVHYRAQGATVVEDIDAALCIAGQESIPDDGIDRSEIWIIGGSQLFQAALPHADKAYVTEIRTEVDADTFAPDILQLVDAGLWRLDNETPWIQPRDVTSAISDFRFVRYERVR
ncbi:MAG: dihydrofolate reductase [Bifidobacterium aquikefiri]|uniref:dihydrofolate reductase n=1 Tax=Bifidobacterium aquikefiri TaxID=1653207 RepID=A0A261G7R4_9BIFI|nr:dihydrofolate reductase [Bifidobacterium aquikefiri]OZG67243.1 diacylglycerol kinase [Bifidobacterium aquikefiri]